MNNKERKIRKDTISRKEQYKIIIGLLKIKPRMCSEIKLPDLQKYASQNRLRELYNAGVIKLNRIEIVGKSRNRVYGLSNDYADKLNALLYEQAHGANFVKEKEAEMHAKAVELQTLWEKCRRDFLAKHPFNELENTFAFAY